MEIQLLLSPFLKNRVKRSFGRKLEDKNALILINLRSLLRFRGVGLQNGKKDSPGALFA